jgi:hypothetical protein
MRYSIDNIVENVLNSWDGDNLYVLRYWTKKSSLADDTTRMILDFKNGIPEAVEIAVGMVLDAISGFEVKLRDELKCRGIASIPSHSKGVRNRAGERLCERVAREVSWLEFYPGALERVRTVAKSAYAPPGERPSEEDHYASIEYRGPTASKRNLSIVMFDDVITRKATSGACRRRIMESTGCKSVVGVFLGRTM